jgi:hypothetical protein
MHVVRTTSNARGSQQLVKLKQERTQGLTQGLSLRLVLKLKQLLQEQWSWHMCCESLQQL